MTKNQTPAEIDSELATIWSAQNKLAARMASYRQMIRDGELIAAGERKVGGRHIPMWMPYQIEDAKSSLVECEAEMAELRAAAAPGEAEYAARQWNRYFIVNNTGGHVHRSMDCSTCFPTTAFGWLPQLSDCVESEMVAEYGEMACTICFPDAPTFKGFADGTSSLAKYSEAEKAEKDAAKAAKAAAKAAKVLNDEDVFPEMGGGSWKVTTVAGAKKELREAAQTIAGFGYSHHRDEAPATREAARKALVAKGVTVEELDTIETKAVKAAQKRGY